MSTHIIVLRGYLTSSHSFFFNDTATTEIYTLSLHDALPIWTDDGEVREKSKAAQLEEIVESLGYLAKWLKSHKLWNNTDRKSTRLNSSHVEISYAVFCLKKKRKRKKI